MPKHRKFRTPRCWLTKARKSKMNTVKGKDGYMMLPTKRKPN